VCVCVCVSGIPMLDNDFRNQEIEYPGVSVLVVSTSARKRLKAFMSLTETQ
jgi:hypothetical protein